MRKYMYKKINLIIMKLLESVLVPCNLAKHNLAYSRDSKHTFSQTHFLPLLPPPHRQRRLHSSLLPTRPTRHGPMESREGTLLRLGLRVLGVPPSLLEELLVVQLLLYLLSPIQHPEALDPRIIARPGANRIFLALHRRKCRRVHGYGGLDTRSAS